MVVLHGLGDSHEGYEWLPHALQLPWLNFALADAPDPYYGGYSWYDFEGEPEPGIERSRALLFALLGQLSARGFPATQTMVFGFSQGCLMTYEAGLRYPERLAGLVGISGYAHQPSTQPQQFSAVAREQRFLITHGRQDPLIPFRTVEAQVRQLQDAGLSIQWLAFEKAHTIAGEPELDQIRRFTLSCYGEAG